MLALALAHPLSYSMGTGVQGHFVGAKWPEYENDLLFPSNAKFKNKWSYTPLPYMLYSVSWQSFAFISIFYYPFELE